MPTVQQQAARMTQRAVDALFHDARHVPADKRDWQPMGEGRTVQSQLVECALTPHFFQLILDGTLPDFGDENVQRQRQAAADALTDLETAEAAAREHYASLCARFEAMPDAELGQTRHVPFRGGMDLPISDILFLPYRNLVYHTGQINYIQLLLGDKETH